MSNVNLKFRVLELSLVLNTGQKIDISSIFEEINIFDNLFVPCMSASIVVRDSVNIAEKIKIGKINEYGTSRVRLHLDKEEGNGNIFEFKKEFIIYKITSEANLNSTTKIYTLNLVNEDFMMNLQKKVYQNYKGTYSEIVEKILKDFLKVPYVNETNDFFKSRIAEVVETNIEKEVNFPNITPFEAINYVTKKATSKQKRADYVFYENKNGYSFIPLSNIFRSIPSFKINFRPKNTGMSDEMEFLGAREMKILSSFDTLETIRDGSYAGKFIGFDTITRTQKVLKVKNIPADITTDIGNKEKTLVDIKNKEGQSPYQTFDSRIVSAPFQFTRKELDYIQKNNPKMNSFIENTEDYIFQRKAIFTNFMQKRLQLVMPGNFGLYSGSTVELFVPNYSIKDGKSSYDDSLDKTLSGKYIIVGTRHIIQTNKHETIIEVATDSGLE